MRGRRHRGRRVDSEKLRQLLLGFQGNASFTQFADSIEKEGQAMRKRGERGRLPSRSSVLAFCRGQKTDQVTWDPLTRILKASIEEIELNTSIMDMSDRLNSYVQLAEDGWYNDEASMQMLRNSLPTMLEDSRTLSCSLDRLDPNNRVLLGNLAGELAGCYWSFFGRKSNPTTSMLLEVAGKCAASIERNDPLHAAAIHGVRYYNAIGPGLEAWCEPDRGLSPFEVENALFSFESAETFFRKSGPIGSPKYGPTGHKTLEQLIFSAQVLIQGGASFRKRAEAMIELAEERSDGADAIVKAHLVVIKSLFSASAGTRIGKQKAKDQLFQARDAFSRFFGTTEHYLVAACGMRLRQFGERLKDTYESDLMVLEASSVKYTDIVDLPAVTIFPRRNR